MTAIFFPVPVLTPAEVTHYRGCLEKHEAKTGAPLQGNWRHKAHLLFTWVDELVHHPKIVAIRNCLLLDFVVLLPSVPSS